jgi:PAS domain S-box-containing protein
MEDKANILLVDDHPANLLALQQVLGDLGHNLVKAASGEEALRQLLNQDFAVVLLDVRLHPGLDGFETAKLIRGRERSRHTPIIFLTAHDDNRLSVEQAYSLGAVDYLVKPLVPVILRAKVAGFIELYQKTEQVKRQAEQLRQLDHRKFERKLAEENARLRVSEERFARFMQFLPGLAWIKDVQGRYVYANDAAEKAFRTPRTELYGMTDEEVFPADTAAQFKENDQRALASGTGGQVVETLEHEDGLLHHSLVTKFPIPGPDGQVALVGGMAIDITDQKRTQASLEESEERFRQLAENLSQVFWMSDTEKSRVLYVSPAYEVVWGRSCESLYEQPRSFLDAIHPEDREHVRVASLERQSRGEPGDVEYRIVRPDGSLRWIRDRSFPVKDWAGRVYRVAGIAEDITERRLAEASLQASERRFKTLADSIPQLAWAAQPDGHIYWYNRRWYEYTGTTLEQMQGWGWQSVHDPEELPKVLQRWKASLASGEPLDMVFPLRGADGRFRPFLTRVLPLRSEDGRILQWFGTNTDITTIREMEEALREADRRKDEFLAMLAHELRNPLAPIRNAVQILRLLGSADPNLQRAQDMIDRQVQHLTRLVDDLLDVSRITRGKITLRREPVELAMVVAQAVEASRPLVDARRHTLTVELPRQPLCVAGDATRLAQVLSNLLNNAAKFTPDGGHVGLTIEAGPGEAVVRVRDDGVGIPAELLPKVFDLFTQGDRSLARSEGGLGIGLTLVKSLVEMHGGRVEARSEGHGKGSEFLVRLPTLDVNLVLVTENGKAGLSPPPCPSRRILVVDDNVDAAESLAAVLSVYRHEVRTAHDGLTSLQVAEEFRPEAVLLDIGLPKMDGYEVARRLRELPGLENVLLAAVTGYGQDVDRRRAEEAGFDAHLVKPAEPVALLRLLARSVRRGGG